MSSLSLYLLGAPRAECDGEALVTDTRKAIALLAYLAVTASTHTRDHLAALLWPDLDQTRARAALRRTLSSIHAGCDAPWLLADREHIGLANDGSVWCDVTEFGSALAERRSHGHAADVVCNRCLVPLERAAALYRDDFMAGFSLRDSVSFDDWQFFQAESLRRDFAETLEHIVEAQSTNHAWQTAISHARRWLSLDPLHEPAHRRLMLLYAWAGERSAALRQYQVCADVLARELDVPPLPKTTALHLALREQREPPPPPVAPRQEAAPRRAPTPVAGPPPPNAETIAPHAWPLVGRGAELAQLHELHRQARGSGRLIVLEGEAGIGKSRLAETMFVGAQQQGALGVAGRCYEGEQNLAYAPFVQILRAAMRLPNSPALLQQMDAHRLAELRRLVPELDSPPVEVVAEPGEAAGARTRLFEAVAHTLFLLLSGNNESVLPGIVLIDDIQWADHASLDLFAYLVHRLAAYPLCLLVTQRSGEPEQEQRLRAVVADAQRRHSADVLKLGRLDVQAVAHLVQSVQPGPGRNPLSPALADRLHAEAEGLPFFVVEYLEALSAQNLSSDLAWPRPEGIRDLLRSRLARVGETEQQLLATAAVIGRSFGFEALRAASGRSEEEAIAAVEILLSRGLIREMAGGAFDFSHEQLRAVVYDELSLTRRRLLHRRVADALITQERLAGRDPASIAAVLGHHYEEAAQTSEAAVAYFQAGERASALYANHEAVAHLRKSQALGYPDKAALHLLQGDVHTLLGDYAAAIAEFDRAAESAPAATLPSVFHRLGRVQHRLGDYAAASTEYEHALGLLEAKNAGDDALRAQILADFGLAEHRRGQTARAVDLTQQALDHAEAAGDEVALTRAQTTLSHLARFAGDTAEALRHARESLVLAEEMQDAALLTASLNAIALAHADAGAPERAIPPLERALALCVRQGDLHRQAALHNNLADVHHLCREQEKAMEHLKQAVALFAEIGSGIGSENPEIWKLTEW